MEFIHSFITEIYIAPLQGYYSEALPTLARLKRSFEARVECVRKNPGEGGVVSKGSPELMGGDLAPSLGEREKFRGPNFRMTCFRKKFPF